jgi:peptide/nickel transport system permease protein
MAATAVDLIDVMSVPSRMISERRRLWRTFVRNRASLLGLILVVLVVLASIAAPLLTPWDPYVQNPVDRLKPPDASHLLGYDAFGRDVLTRVLYAGRISLAVGIASVALGGAVGVILGLLAGYLGGWVENVIMRFVDVLMAFPSLLLGLAVLAVLGPGLPNTILAIGMVLSPAFARVVHACALKLKNQQFVEAAQCVGAGHLRIMRLHILPNALGEVVVLSSLWIASAIRIEASLSFIGLGVSPPTATWGNMIRDGTLQL